MTTEFAEIKDYKRITVRKYRSKKLNNLDEIEKFLQTQISKSNPSNKSKHTYNKLKDKLMKKSPQKRKVQHQGPDGFTKW